MNNESIIPPPSLTLENNGQILPPSSLKVLSNTITSQQTTVPPYSDISIPQSNNVILLSKPLITPPTTISSTTTTTIPSVTRSPILSYLLKHIYLSTFSISIILITLIVILILYFVTNVLPISYLTNSTPIPIKSTTNTNHSSSSSMMPIHKSSSSSTAVRSISSTPILTSTPIPIQPASSSSSSLPGPICIPNQGICNIVNKILSPTYIQNNKIRIAVCGGGTAAGLWASQPGMFPNGTSYVARLQNYFANITGLQFVSGYVMATSSYQFGAYFITGGVLLPVTWTGAWTPGKGSGGPGGTYIFTQVAGPTLTFTLYGSMLTFDYITQPIASSGSGAVCSFDLFIDSVYIETISCNTAALYTFKTSSTYSVAYGKHTLMIVSTLVPGNPAGQSDIQSVVISGACGENPKGVIVDVYASASVGLDFFLGTPASPNLFPGQFYSGGSSQTQRPADLVILDFGLEDVYQNTPITPSQFTSDLNSFITGYPINTPMMEVFIGIPAAILGSTGASYYTQYITAGQSIFSLVFDLYTQMFQGLDSLANSYGYFGNYQDLTSTGSSHVAADITPSDKGHCIISTWILQTMNINITTTTGIRTLNPLQYCIQSPIPPI